MAGDGRRIAVPDSRADRESYAQYTEEVLVRDIGRVDSEIELPKAGVLAQALAYTDGVMFWLRRKKLVGSYLFFSVTNRWYVWGLKAART